MRAFRSWGGSAVAVVLAVGACSGGPRSPTVAHLGSASTTSAPPSAGSGVVASGAELSKMEGYAQCMRTHGVPSFPDPTSGPNGGAGFAIGGNGTVHLDPNSPAFKNADKACGNLLPDKGVAKELTAAQQQAFLNWAACIRTHGIPDFPDPQFSGGGVRISLSARGAAAANSGGPSALLKTAQKACASKLPAGVGKLGG